MFKKKNYKLFIGIIVGIIISLTITMASAESYSSTASDVYYDTDIEQILSHEYNNVQDALDEIYISNNCPYGHYCKKYKYYLELGDYVRYRANSSSYTTNTSYTGYSSSQTIYPDELNLWRVLNINDDGTVDLISEYVSSTEVCFSGITGYRNIVGYLNVLASQYESPLTIDSRHFGYDGQTEYITDTSYFTATAPWTSSTIDNSKEAYGGGDILYSKDVEQTETVLGTLAAKNISYPDEQWYYFIASRYYTYVDVTYFAWNGRTVDDTGVFDWGSMLYFDKKNSSLSDLTDGTLCASIRPIVTLDSGLQYEGLGTEYSPMDIMS